MSKVYTATVEVYVDGEVGLEDLKDHLTELVMLELDTEGVDAPDGVEVAAVEILWEDLKPYEAPR